MEDRERVDMLVYAIREFLTELGIPADGGDRKPSDFDTLIALNRLQGRLLEIPTSY